MKEIELNSYNNYVISTVYLLTTHTTHMHTRTHTHTHTQIIPLVNDFVKIKLGEKFVDPPPFDLAKSYADSKNVMPLIFVLSPGADPMASLLKFAEDRGFSGDKFNTISLGQGQVSTVLRSAPR